MKDGSWAAYEIKLGAYRIDEAANNLLKIQEALTSDGGAAPILNAVIVGLGNAAYQREDGVYVVPITTLGP